MRCKLRGRCFSSNICLYQSKYNIKLLKIPWKVCFRTSLMRVVGNNCGMNRCDANWGEDAPLATCRRSTGSAIVHNALATWKRPQLGPAKNRPTSLNNVSWTSTVTKIQTKINTREKIIASNKQTNFSEQSKIQGWKQRWKQRQIPRHLNRCQKQTNYNCLWICPNSCLSKVNPQPWHENFHK